MTTTYDPKHPVVPRRGRRPRRADPGLRPVPRLPAVLQVLHLVPDAVRDDRPARRPGRRPAHPCPAGPGRRRVLPVQALLHQLPLHPRAPRVGARLPPPDAARRRDAPRQPSRSRPRAAHHPGDGAHRSAGQARHHHRPHRQQGHRCRARLPRPQGRREGHRRVVASACCRRTPSSASPPGSRSGPRCASTKRQGRVAVFPTCLVEYQEPDIGKTSSRSTSATASSAPSPKAPAAAAPRGCTRGDVEEFTKVAEKNVKALAA